MKIQKFNDDDDLEYKKSPKVVPISTIQLLDIDPISDRYEQLITELKEFLNSDSLPVTKSMLIGFANRCTSYETSLIALKSELAMTKSELVRDYKQIYKRTYDQSSLGQRWETKIGVDMDPVIADTQMKIDKLDAMLSALDDFKWILKSNRDIAKDYVFHLNS